MIFCPGDDTKLSVIHVSFFTLLMSTSLMIAALRRGQTGSEILSILEALTSPSEQSTVQSSATATFEPVEF